MTKSDLRQQVRALKHACPVPERQRLSLQLQQRILDHPRWHQAHSVVLYHALPDEVDTTLLLGTALEQHKEVLLPVVRDEDLLLLPFTGFDSLREGAFHIMEPEGGAGDATPVSGADLIVVPGMAFTADGRRLGRGRGYYDRLLVRLEGYRMGLCWPFCLLPDIPGEPHDIPVDEVIS